MLLFLNQVHADCRPVRTWFLKIVPVRMSVCVFCVCLCPSLRLYITSGVMWHDMDPIRLVIIRNSGYSCYVETVVVIINEHGLGIGMRRKH